MELHIILPASSLLGIGFAFMAGAAVLVIIKHILDIVWS